MKAACRIACKRCVALSIENNEPSPDNKAFAMGREPSFVSKLMWRNAQMMGVRPFVLQLNV